MKTRNEKARKYRNHDFERRQLNELGLNVSDHVSAMLAYWDKNQICRYANNAYRDWFGKTREEMIGKITMKELLGPLYEKNLVYILGALNGQVQTFEREIPVPGEQGKIRYSLANYYPDIKDGEVKGFFVHVADITTVKKLELELRASEVKFKGFLESAPDAIVIVNDQGIIQLINAKCKQLFGYSKKELCGVPVEFLMPERFRKSHITERINYFSNPRSRPMGIGMKLFGLHKDGTEFPVEISLGPMQTNEGILVSAAIRDISWKVQKDNQLLQSMEIISNQNKQLVNFAYIVSHNLKSYSNNLASVLSLLDLADSEKEKNEMIGLIKNISSSFSSTVTNLNEIVEVQNKGYLERTRINLYQQIEKCLGSLALQIKMSGAIIHNQVNKEVNFLYNEAYMESILHNFITNSIKYRHPKRIPVVKISSLIQGQYLILQIEDNGRGINLKMYGDKLFGMYKTFHGNPDAKGMGLFLTKYQVEALGGRIEVQSEEGIGTTFKIYFRL